MQLTPDEDARVLLLSTASLSGLLMLVLGAVAGAGEYRHGTIASTLLVTPNRLRAVTAQTIAVASAAPRWVSRRQRSPRRSRLPWLASNDAPMPGTSDAARHLFGNILYSGLAAALWAWRSARSCATRWPRSFSAAPYLRRRSGHRRAGRGLRPLLAERPDAAMSGGTSEDFGADLLPFVAAAAVWAGYTAPAGDGGGRSHDARGYLENLHVRVVPDDEAIRLRERRPAADRHVLADQARLDAVVEVGDPRS